MKRMIYVIGALANPKVPLVARKLRKLFPDCEIFDSWYSPGPEADEYWRKYEKAKGISYKEALNDWAATHIFEFDKFHLERATDVVMVMPTGKSGHLELGWSLGKGKRGYVLFDKEPKKWDIMYQFATDVFFSFDELAEGLKSQPEEIKAELPMNLNGRGLRRVKSPEVESKVRGGFE